MSDINWDKEFPYKVEICGFNYDIDHDVYLWCVERFGLNHEKICEETYCEFSQEKWDDDTRAVNHCSKMRDDYEESIGIPPCSFKEPMHHESWYDFFFFVNDHPSYPEIHGHTGTWRYRHSKKIGYDYGRYYFYFENQEDALEFKLIQCT